MKGWRESEGDGGGLFCWSGVSVCGGEEEEEDDDGDEKGEERRGERQYRAAGAAADWLQSGIGTRALLRREEEAGRTRSNGATSAQQNTEPNNTL